MPDFNSSTVPRTLDAELVIDNKDFKDEYSDPNSEEYKLMARTLEEKVCYLQLYIYIHYTDYFLSQIELNKVYSYAYKNYLTVAGSFI